MYNSFSKKQLAALIMTGVLTTQIGLGVVSYANIDTLDMRLISASTTATEITSVDGLIEGNVYSGFKVIKKSYSKDLGAPVYELIHEKTGGKLVYIANDDTNKWFEIVFKTPAVDSTGVNHIIEHTVLEGSDKYDVKSPYTEMSKRSVNTFMNAFTGLDMTTYPIASENDQDFKNLMSVYMDAVFAPKVTQNPMLLQQEGWRYEVDAKNGKVSYNGVIFNEMKATVSDCYNNIAVALGKVVYPDTKYRYNSGGDPEYIVDLSHKQLVDIYKNYYNPSNACITLYGKMDIFERLAFIDEAYYSKYTKAPNVIDDKIQERFSEAKTYAYTYPARKSSTPEKDSILTWSLSLDQTTEKDRLGLSILAMLLSDPRYSAIYQDVANDADESFTASLVTEYYQPMFSLMYEGAGDDEMDKFDSIIRKRLEEMVKKGVNKERLMAVINKYEMAFKANLTSANRGKMAIDATSVGYVLYDNPTMALNQSELLEGIKSKDVSEKYFESLIKKYLLNNPHLVKATFVPDADYMKKYQVKLDQKLNQRTCNISKKEDKAIKETAKAYETWQAKPIDPQAIAKLPRLKISDIDTVIDEHPVFKEDKLGGIFIKHQAETQGLSQINLYYDMSVLSEEELKYMELFTTVLETANTKNYKYSTMQSYLEKSSNGVDMSYSYLDDRNNANKSYGYFTVSSTYMKGHEELTYKILTEILRRANVKNKDLIKYRLSELVESTSNEKSYYAPQWASLKLQSSLSAAGKLNEMKYSSAYEALKTADEHFESSYADIEKHLDSIYNKLFNRNNMILSITSDEDGLKKAQYYCDTLMSGMSAEKVEPYNWAMMPMAQKTAIAFPTESQYVEFGFNFNQIGEKVSGEDLVFAQILNEGYMYERIRLKGGAYGGNMSISLNGNVHFSTNRDPNFKSSIEAIKGLNVYLKTLKLTQADVDNAIIAVAGNIGRNRGVFEESLLEDTKYMGKYDETEREKLIEEILSTKVEDLNKFAAKMEKGLKVSSFVIAGSEEKINENKNMFESIIENE